MYLQHTMLLCVFCQPSVICLKLQHILLQDLQRCAHRLSQSDQPLPYGQTAAAHGTPLLKELLAGLQLALGADVKRTRAAYHLAGVGTGVLDLASLHCCTHTTSSDCL